MGAIALAAIALGAAAVKLAQAISARNGAEKSDAVWEIIARVDSEGAPLVYFPRRAIKILEELSRHTQTMAAETRDRGDQLRRLVAAQEELVREITRQSDLLDRRIAHYEEAGRDTLREIRRKVNVLVNVWGGGD